MSTSKLILIAIVVFGLLYYAGDLGVRNPASLPAERIAEIAEGADNPEQFARDAQIVDDVMIQQIPGVSRLAGIIGIAVLFYALLFRAKPEHFS